MAFYSAIGIGLGLYFITLLDEDALRRGLGVFLIVYSLYALATAGAAPVLPSRWRRALAATTGVIGGLLGTLFGAGVGPIYVVYFNTLRMEREMQAREKHARSREPNKMGGANHRPAPRNEQG